MGDVRWREAERAQARAAAEANRRARASWPLAVVDLDLIDHTARYIVRKDPTIELRDAADTAFATARARGAFPDRDADDYFDVALIDWAEAFALIRPDEWITAGLEILVGPVDGLSLGAFESLAIDGDLHRYDDTVDVFVDQF